jgi:uncharacterized protein YwqG
MLDWLRRLLRRGTPADAAEAKPAARPLDPARVEATIRPFARITATPGPTKPWESKFGGSPYLPLGTDYPRDRDGEPLRLLAQLNLAELPALEAFPREGIVEFFISANDDVYGMDNELTMQRNFRVLYFPEVVEDASRLQELPVADHADDTMFPIARESRVTFTLESAPITLEDFRAERALGLEGVDGEFTEAYAREWDGTGHKVGGYPYFTQYDPREGRHEGHDVLLLQIDSDEDAGIMWGDVGVGSFFIREQDLRNASFGDVLYTWDCC